ncbi:MAG: hypothetical protein ABEJ23_08560 [Haloarculaceae archaeon]
MLPPWSGSPSSGRDVVPDALPVPPRVAVPALFLWLAAVQSLHRYVRLSRPSVGLHPDVTSAWLPVAEAVFAGTPLYAPGATDNKPPLFELLNLAVYATDHYVLAFLALVGLANGAVAALLWQVGRRHGASRVGLVAGVLYLGALPVVDGTAINVRSFAMVGVLAALVARRPAARGVALAAGALCSQYALLALPLVALDGLSDALAARRRGLWRFGAATGATLIAGFAAVGLIWGPTAAVDALHWSVGRAPRYVLAVGPSVLTLPSTWARLLVGMHLRLLGLVWFGALGLLIVGHAARQGAEWGVGPLAALLGVTFGIPLFVRPFATYWLYPLPGIALLSAMGLRTVLAR